MKTLTQITVIAASLLVATTSLRADALLTSFESASELFPANASMGNIAQSSLFATDGVASMKVDILSGNWNWSSKTYGASSYSDWFSHKKLEIDLTRVTSIANGANLEFVLAMNGPQGWNQQQLINWVWLNPGLTQSSTLVLDYTAIRNGAPAPTGPSDWWQLNIVARSGQAGQTIYLDDIRFVEVVPEPTAASLLLLGIGSLVAVRRRLQR